jgi:hypothetical protein
MRRATTTGTTEEDATHTPAHDDDDDEVCGDDERDCKLGTMINNTGIAYSSIKVKSGTQPIIIIVNLLIGAHYLYFYRDI